MDYMDEYDWSYEDGVVNKSITISITAQQLLDSNEIKNVSKFINALIVDALQDGDFFKKKHLRAINIHIAKLNQLTGKTMRIMEEVPNDGNQTQPNA